MEDLVVFDDFTFTYPDGTVALKNLNLRFKKGESIGVIGQNGAGKTTLCRAMMGVVPHIKEGKMEGSLVVGGMKTTEHNIYEIAQKAGLLLQNPDTSLIANDVTAEFYFGPENLGVSREDILKRFDWTIKAVRLEGMEDRPPTDLSGGQKQRCALGSVLMMEPEILILDEPTSQLDPIGTTEVFTAAKDLKERANVLTIITSHKTSELAEFVDRLVLLDKGEVLAVGSPREVLSRTDLLAKTTVRPPPVTTLAKEAVRKLGLNEKEVGLLPTTLEEAKTFFSKLGRVAEILPRPGAKAKRRKPSAEPILEVRNLNYTYAGPPPVRALRNVNLKIYGGEFIGIIGQNGAGKTTLVKNLTGLYKPTEGQVLFEGKDTKEISLGELARQVGLVLQNPDSQIFNTTVEEEVAFAPKAIGCPKEEIEERVDHALELVAWEKSRAIYPPLLSFGDRRIVAVASVLALDPKVLILDEPTTAQDHKGRYRLMDLSKKLNEEGKTIIAISHDMDIIYKYTDRTIVLGQGDLLLDDTTPKVFEQTEILKKTYIEPPQEVQLRQMLGEG